MGLWSLLFDKYSRSMKWKESFFKCDEEKSSNVTTVANVSNVIDVSDVVHVANVFKPQKTNLPSTRTLNAL